MASKNLPASTVTARLPRTSIHTPLQPASVQDLKAKFDPGSASNHGGSGDADKPTSVSGSVRIKSSSAHSPLSDRRSQADTAGGTDTSSSSTSANFKATSNVTLSSISTSLQAAANRKLGTNLGSSSTVVKQGTSSSSIKLGSEPASSSTSKLNTHSSSAAIKSGISTTASTASSASLGVTTKGSIALTTARPFSPPSLSSKSVSAPSSGKSSPVLVTSPKSSSAAKWEPKSVAKNATWSSSSSTTTTSRHSSSTNSALTSNELRSSFEKDKEGRLELPVMHIITSGSEVKVELGQKSTTLPNKMRNGNESGSRYLSKSISESSAGVLDDSKTKFRSEKSITVENSPPVQRSNRLVAREIKIERLDTGENVTSYKDKPLDSPKSRIKTNKTDVERASSAGTKVREIKVERIPSSEQTTGPQKEKPEFAQIKLRNTKLNQEGTAKSNTAGSVPRMKSSDLDDKRMSRKISSERFERLMFDFQRGVPTETIPRRDSETDHIILQQKARELSKPDVEEDVPIIIKKKKEESIFTEGLKVSDFVKQVNKMNPEVDGPPKWKIQKARSQTSSTASSDVGGDNFYQGIPGEEDMKNMSDEDDIYEMVANKDQPSTTVEQNGDAVKVPIRRLGVYRQMRLLTNSAFNRLKRGSKKGKKTLSKSETLSDSEEKVIHSDGEGGWEQSDRSSTGTEYEDVEPDSDSGALEEKECFYEDLEDILKPAGNDTKNKTLGNKLKNIFTNKKAKAKKSKPAAESGGTDSEDFLEDTDEVDIDLTDSISRTSSERSSGRLPRDDATLSSISTTTSGATTASYTEEVQTVAVSNQTHSSMASSNMPPPPPLPPRTSKALNQLPENSPPLPPRNPALSNKATLGIPLDTVVPVSPPGRSSGNAYNNKKKDRFSFTHDDPSQKLEYIDYDPASPNTLERLERTERKSGNSSRPASSASTLSSNSSYIYPDISAFPELKGGSSDENLYVDLEDEQIYGKPMDIYVSRFQSEPLYQWYSKDKMIQNIRSDKPHPDDLSDEEYLEVDDKKHRPESLYEDVERLLEKTSSSSSITTAGSTKRDSKDSESSVSSISAKDKPQRRSVIEDVFKKGGTLHRALWCQMPEVIESGLLQKLPDQEKKIQEAMFEIMTSEASYLKSLKVLISVFLTAPEFSAELSDRCVINRRERQILFSNIGHIKDISEEFLKDLEARWQESCYMNDVCDIIYKHASKNFEPYVRYCSNQAFQDRILCNLKLKSDFNEAVKRLEQHSDCQFLPLASFLLLPMQRITRMPLLVDAIYHRLEQGSPRHASAKKALDSLTKVAKRCDEAAKKMQQTEQIAHLASNLEFKIKATIHCPLPFFQEFPLVSSSRFLVKQGEMTLIKSDGTTRKPLSKLLGSHKEHVYLFLFNDILLVTKKKGLNFQVRDYCQRNSLIVEAIDNPEKSPRLPPGTATGFPNILFLAMLANHENKQVELVLSCKAESERTRWVDAIVPSQTSSENERIYDFWDCPQFQCVRKYIAQQPDELTLEESDVINVTRKMADGWCEGERIRDGEKGWFPASHTEEINNSHVRARNLRLRYRLMLASQEYSKMEKH
ncbi:unnamed protein product [Lymnaea stagnalis]|uniref:Rho guanine nucleotide exchange factor 26 n=1 Tax=Lymnaea stagnalis TaxID=6523 RepID=A0AAV2H900_LYMST